MFIYIVILVTAGQETCKRAAPLQSRSGSYTYPDFEDCPLQHQRGATRLVRDAQICGAVSRRRLVHSPAHDSLPIDLLSSVALYPTNSPTLPRSTNS